VESFFKEACGIQEELKANIKLRNL
jgi:hypothetical protein